MRPPVDDIPAPPFPAGLPWVNVAPLRMDKQRGRPVLVEFWDFCRPSSLRTLPYVKAWHERYAARRPARRDRPLPRVRARRGRGRRPRGRRRAWGSSTRSASTCGFELWRAYDNEGWPARYLWDGDGHLAEYHYGEGGYAETELAIQELLGIEREPLAPLHPEDEPDALIVGPDARPAGRLQRPVRRRRRVGGARAGAASCTSTASGSPCSGPAPTCSSSIPTTSRPCSTCASATGVTCYATCFTPGVGAAGGLSAPALDALAAAARSAARRRSSSSTAPPGQYGLPQSRSRYIDS